MLRFSNSAEIGTAVALELQGKLYTPIHDLQGNLTLLLDSKGDPVESYRYSAYGERTSSSKVSCPWGFQSKRIEETTGWSSFGRRFYDPVIGRWLSEDPFGYEAGPNLYGYLFNSPMTYIDGYGEIAFIPFLLTLAISVAVQSINNHLDKTPQSFELSFNSSNDYSWNSPAQTVDQKMSEQLNYFADQVSVTVVNAIICTTETFCEFSTGCVEGFFSVEFGDTESGSSRDWGRSIGYGADCVSTASFVCSGAAFGFVVTKQVAKTALQKRVGKQFITTLGGKQAAKTRVQVIAGSYRPSRELPKNKHGVLQSDAKVPHTQIGTKKGSKGDYTQAREWGYCENGDLVPRRDIDFTDHGRWRDHTNPHQHRWLRDSPRGSPRRGDAIPLEEIL